jgi:hypothetical protein
MKILKITVFGSIFLLSMAFPSMVANSATTCFKAGEQISGMNKICYYNCMGSTAAITISSVSLCPLSIQR